MKPLKVVQSKVEGIHCDGCAYQATGVRRVAASGTGTNGVLIVGDSPWVDEVAIGKPFAGASGRFLESILTKRGLAREDFLISNSLWCKPPALGMNDDLEGNLDAERAARQCRPYLDTLIREKKPKVLLAVGGVALKRLTGFENIEVNHGYVFPTEYGIPCVPTFHPSGLIQGNWNLTIAFVLGIARAMEVSDGRYQGTGCKLVEDPDPGYLGFPGNGDITTPVMCDIETSKSLAGRNEEEAEDDPSYQIIRMGFSVTPWSGVSFPFEGDYIRRAKDVLKRAKQVIFWNKNYDLPRLKANGFTFHPDVVIVDAMWAWHWLYSDLPKALAFAAPFFYSGAAWKHLSSQRPAFYNAMDNAVQMGIYQGTKAQLEKDGRWDRFWSHCVKVDPIYVRMGLAGVKVDKEAREVFMGALEKEAVEELVKVQDLLPPSLVKVQESFKALKVPSGWDSITEKMRNSLVRVERVEVPAVHKDGSPVLTQDGEPLHRPLWRRYAPFNPNSRDDLLGLMLAIKVKPPKARGADRESTEAKYLKRIGVKHPILRHCVNFKQRSKLISTYNWPLDELDRAHTTYGFHPSTWRSSSRNVNLGNIPKRQELAKLFRRLLIADKGCRLIEIDRSAIEAVLVGHWAKSPAYINLAKAGVHDWLASYMVGEPVDYNLPFLELRAALKIIKKRFPEEREKAKRCIHGTNYLLSAFGMHDEYEEAFPTEYEASRVQDIYLNSPAGMDVRRWHKGTLEEAFHKKYLDNSFQYRHYFYGPLYKFSKRAKKWEVEPDGDAKRAIAFRPQSDAAAVQREDLLALEQVDWFSKLIRLPTYDSIVVEAPVELVDKSIELLCAQFAKAIPELGGLTIGFEVRVGENLQEMSEVTI